MREFDTILITGGTGQDAQIMLDRLATTRFKIVCTFSNAIDLNSLSRKAEKRIAYENLDIRDTSRFMEIIKRYEPKVIYNFAGRSSVRDSYKFPTEYMETNAYSVERILLSLHTSGYFKHCRFYQASSSEIFDPYEMEARNETSAKNPISPYGKSKLYSHNLAQFYREQYGYFVSSGITFNHESEYRSEKFLFGKVMWGLARILNGKQSKLAVGNLNSRRDWGYAPDYIDAMLLMMFSEKPRDFVISSGKLHSVYEVIQTAYRFCDIATPLSEILIAEQVLPEYKDYTDLFGDSSQIEATLGWKPKFDFYQTIQRIQKSIIAKSRKAD